MNDSIKKMLRITEKDLMITEVSYETLQKKKTLVVDAVLSPTPRACRSCGSTVVDGNGKAIIVKNGKKETIVRFEQYTLSTAFIDVSTVLSNKPVAPFLMPCQVFENHSFIPDQASLTLSTAFDAISLAEFQVSIPQSFIF
ncbi:hypothetical protein EfmGK961_02950 [Enterococcus faecium]|nr:hypothetical protein EfmGK961_02950 [Enterococcus faecium]